VRGGTFDISLRRPQLLRYDSQNPIHVSQHVIIPKPQHQKSRFPKSCGTAPICLTSLRMLPAVQLDNQPHFVTKKIRHIAANWNLSAELQPEKLPVADA
jgi:hypothetical protein